MVHTQYIEDVFTGKVTQGLAADGFDNVLQGDEIKTTVLEVRLGFKVAFTAGDIPLVP